MTNKKHRQWKWVPEDGSLPYWPFVIVATVGFIIIFVL